MSLVGKITYLWTASWPYGAYWDPPVCIQKRYRLLDQGGNWVVYLR